MARAIGVGVTSYLEMQGILTQPAAKTFNSKPQPSGGPLHLCRLARSRKIEITRALITVCRIQHTKTHRQIQ